jgi:uncharacterized protein
MLELGRFNELEVVKEVPFGMYLASDKGEILLPTKYISPDTTIGDKVKVFIYKDSEDRLIATNLIPVAQAGEFGAMEVADVNDTGAFLDWGLEKHLLVPYKEQHVPMKKGNKYVVRVSVDPKTDRIIGIAKLAPFLSKEVKDLSEREEVDLLIYEITDLGIMAIINNKFKGMLYKNEVFRELNIGDKLKGYVKKIREDNKIDLSIRKEGYEGVEDSRDVILEKLKLSGGKLNLSDNSDPEEIKKMLSMSKKNFKKAIGALYKEGKIDITEEGIKLKKT